MTLYNVLQADSRADLRARLRLALTERMHLSREQIYSGYLCATAWERKIYFELWKCLCESERTGATLKATIQKQYN